MQLIKSRLSRRETLFASAAATGAAAILHRSPAAARSTSNMGALPVKKIEGVFGTAGTLEEGVLTFDFGRSDFSKTSLMGVHVDMDIGFDTEITFQPAGDDALVKWEFCLLDQEVNGVLDGLLQAHIEPHLTNVNALHNHFLQPKPEVKFIHGTALGNPVGIAKSLYAALKNNRGQPFESSPPQDTGLPNKQIAQTIGGAHSIRGPVLSITVDRETRGLELGIRVIPASQNQSMFNFQKGERWRRSGGGVCARVRGGGKGRVGDADERVQDHGASQPRNR